MVSGALEALDIAYDLFRDEDEAADVVDDANAPETDVALAVAGAGEAESAIEDDPADTVLTPSSLAQALQSLQRAGTQ